MDYPAVTAAVCCGKERKATNGAGGRRRAALAGGCEIDLCLHNVLLTRFALSFERHAGNFLSLFSQSLAVPLVPPKEAADAGVGIGILG